MEQTIYINTIHMDRSALRESVTDESVRLLAESIQLHGLLQAIVVTPRDGGGYRLIAGRRRITACKLLQMQTIPARVIESEHIDEIPALAENLMRLNMNPVEEAEAVRILHEEKGMSQREICEMTNHGTSWVQDRLMLCSMPDTFKKAVAQKNLTIAAAGILLQIQQEDYRDYLLSVAIVNGATVNQCQGWLLDYQARSKIMNPTGQQPIEPRLPMETPEPQCLCHFCEQSVKAHMTVILRFCYPCSETLDAVKKELPKETPPTPEVKTLHVPT
ncbi:MAG: ParB/RepB/Spo0J family partition protein [Burkholderiales bacterium]